jgi:hypothetical protein
MSSLREPTCCVAGKLKPRRLLLTKPLGCFFQDHVFQHGTDNQLGKERTHGFDLSLELQKPIDFPSLAASAFG